MHGQYFAGNSILILVSYQQYYIIQIVGVRIKVSKITCAGSIPLKLTLCSEFHKHCHPPYKCAAAFAAHKMSWKLMRAALFTICHPS